MNDHVNSDTTTSRKILKPRRLALLGTVAALGVAVLAASPASSQFGLTSFIGPAAIGVLTLAFQSQRVGVAVGLVFLIAGLLVMFKVREEPTPG